jgi:hypothetical protein
LNRSRIAWIVLASAVALTALTAGTGGGGRTANAAGAGTPVWQPWFDVRPSTTAAPGAPVTAVWRDQHHLDLFVTERGGK